MARRPFLSSERRDPNPSSYNPSSNDTNHGEAAVLELGEEGHLTLARGLRVLVRVIGLGLLG